MLAEELKPIEQLLVALESSNRKYDLDKMYKDIEGEGLQPVLNDYLYV